MKKLALILCGLLIAAAPVFAGVERLSDISSTITSLNGDQHRVWAGNWTSAQIYGICNGVGARVGLYQSIDGTSWKPLYGWFAGDGMAADSAFTYSFSAGERLNVVLPVMAQCKYLSGAWTRVLTPLNYGWLKVVVTNTNAGGSLTANRWYILYK